jgi:hypothetical protein
MFTIQQGLNHGLLQSQSIFNIMVPPNFEYPSQTKRKKRSAMRSPQDTTTDVVNIHPEGVMDMDSIPSPFIEPISPTLVEEQ